MGKKRQGIIIQVLVGDGVLTSALGAITVTGKQVEFMKHQILHRKKGLEHLKMLSKNKGKKCRVTQRFNNVDRINICMGQKEQ